MDERLDDVLRICSPSPRVREMGGIFSFDIPRDYFGSWSLDRGLDVK